jgi:hypothetical protein
MPRDERADKVSRVGGSRASAGSGSLSVDQARAANVFVIIEIGARRIVRGNATTNPTLPWVKPQVREATARRQTPRFLVHDNDGIFGPFGRPVKAERDGRKRGYRSHLDLWQNIIAGIEGPMPGAAADPALAVLVRLSHRWRLPRIAPAGRARAPQS